MFAVALRLLIYVRVSPGGWKIENSKDSVFLKYLLGSSVVRNNFGYLNFKKCRYIVSAYARDPQDGEDICNECELF